MNKLRYQEKLKTQYNLEEVKKKNVRELNMLLSENPIMISYIEVFEKINH
ncbi:MAG: hypothetical protein OWQ48_01770 [Desulfurococcus sp.]|nr:hypothetical protein [Desulfurococcus sp.]